MTRRCLMICRSPSISISSVESIVLRTIKTKRSSCFGNLICSKSIVPVRPRSHGACVRSLAVCCAYLFEPSVLLLDEPLTGLDPPGIRTLLDSIRARAAAGATVIISSHLLAMIEDVCTHLLVMQEGRTQYFGAAADSAKPISRNQLARRCLLCRHRRRCDSKGSSRLGTDDDTDIRVPQRSDLVIGGSPLSSWDEPSTHWELARLTAMRGRFRVRRTT